MTGRFRFIFLIFFFIFSFGHCIGTRDTSIPTFSKGVFRALRRYNRPLDRFARPKGSKETWERTPNQIKQGCKTCRTLKRAKELLPEGGQRIGPSRARHVMRNVLQHEPLIREHVTDTAETLWLNELTSKLRKEGEIHVSVVACG